MYVHVLPFQNICSLTYFQIKILVPMIKQKISNTLFYKRSFFGGVPSKLIFFLISALNYAFNMLEIVQSTLKQLNKRLFGGSTFYVHLRHLIDLPKNKIHSCNSQFLFLSILEIMFSCMCLFAVRAFSGVLTFAKFVTFL